jgi:hypothetical protein
VDVPANGVESKISAEDLEANLDPKTPPNPLRYFPLRIGSAKVPASNVVIEHLRYTGHDKAIGGGSIGWFPVSAILVLAAYVFGFLMNLSFWPFSVGQATELSYVPGAPPLENLHRFLIYTLTTSTLGWDTGRAITNAVAIVVLFDHGGEQTPQPDTVAAHRERHQPQVVI